MNECLIHGVGFIDDSFYFPAFNQLLQGEQVSFSLTCESESGRLVGKTGSDYRTNHYGQVGITSQVASTQ